MPRFVNYRIVGSSTTSLASGDVPFTISGLAAGNYEVNDGLAWRGPYTVTASGGGTPTPTPGPTLSALTVSPNTATVGTAYSGTVSGKTSSSTLALSGAGAAGLSISGTTISGTPTTAGSVDIVETLSGATNTPRTTSGVMTVAAASGGTGPAVLVNDTFTASDNTLLTAHAPDTGGSWALQPTTTAPASGSEPRILSNRLVFPEAGAYQNTTDLPADCQVEAQLTALSFPTASDATQVGVILRASSSANTLYTVRKQIGSGGSVPNGTYQLVKFVNNAPTVVGSFATVGSINVSLAEFRATIRTIGGNVTVEVFENGASLGTLTDSSSPITTAGRGGARVTYSGTGYRSSSSTGVHLDNVKFSSLA